MSKLTVAQALVKFLDNQYISVDGVESRFVEGISVIFGHGIVVGLGEALISGNHGLKVLQGKNEQGQAHMAIGFAKQNLRRKIIAVSASVGPGSANMVTAAATATANNIPLLIIAADTFATRQPDPVLQQIEQSHDLTITTNDAFRPVSRYFDRINRPEQLMTALINAMRALTSVDAAGAVTIALPQDVAGEAFDFPEGFFRKRIHHILRPGCDATMLAEAVEWIKEAKRPLIICGGGAKYSDAGKQLADFCTKFNIPFGETQAGKSTITSDFALNLGGIGVTGNLSANKYARDCDLIIGLGTRMTDFTTGSKELFAKARVIQVNASPFHSYKLDAMGLIGDVKTILGQLEVELSKAGYCCEQNMAAELKKEWAEEYARLTSATNENGLHLEINHDFKAQAEEFAELTGSRLSQARVISIINERINPNSVVVAASGSLPGDFQRMWKSGSENCYHVEYGYSCMGYEIAAALGAKIAQPERDSYAFVGDAAFVMLHSELLTSLQEHKKINVVLFDNMSNGCINNLQMNSGMDSFCTDFRYRNEATGLLDGGYIQTDYAKIAEGYGCKSYTITNEEQLIQALEDSKSCERSVLFDIKVLPKSMSDGYESWWNIGLAAESNIDSVKTKYAELVKTRESARKY